MPGFIPDAIVPLDDGILQGVACLVSRNIIELLFRKKHAFEFALSHRTFSVQDVQGIGDPPDGLGEPVLDEVLLPVGAGLF